MKRRGILALICLMIFLIGFVSAYEIVIDDGDSEFSIVGSWANTLNACGWNGDYDYETDALVNNTARWDPNITYAGNYEVYVYYCVHSARPNAVPFRVRDANGIFTVFIDETLNASGVFSGDFSASGWKLLGVYSFNLTTDTPNQFVRLTTSSAGDTSADAVRFVFIENPAINFVPVTETGLINRNNFFVNVTAVSSYLNNITLNLYDSLGVWINSAVSFTSNLDNQFTSLADGTYFYNATAYDSFGNVNNTETLDITLDATAPVIYNPVTNPVCAFNYTDILLGADIADLRTDRVRIKGNWRSVNGNYSVTNCTSINSSDESCYYTADSRYLSNGESFYWFFYANDTAENTGQGVTNYFNVTYRTDLIVNPVVPNGLNGWYTIIPNFTLVNPDALQTYYKWLEITNEINYSGIFWLDDLPVLDRTRLGTFTLVWRANTTCGNETEQNSTIKIDISSPSIIFNLPNVGYTFINPLQNVSAEFLDPYPEYGSGVDNSTIRMEINGINVSFILENALGGRTKAIYEGNLGQGLQIVNFSMRDFAGNYVEKVWNFTINSSVTNFTIYSPNVLYYNNRHVPFNISGSALYAHISYNREHPCSDNVPLYLIFCTKCSNYGFFDLKKALVCEGDNNITIRVRDFFGNEGFQGINLFVDSVKPKIRNVLPKARSTINSSSFSVTYTEQNLRNISLFYTSNNITREIVRTDCLSGINQICAFDNVNMSEIDGTNVVYWFVLSDVINRLNTRRYSINADITPPVFNLATPVNGANYGRYVSFNFTSNEKVNVKYSYPTLFGIRNKIIAYNKLNYFGRYYFSTGNYNMDITATDAGGNSVTLNRNFNVA